MEWRLSNSYWYAMICSLTLYHRLDKCLQCQNSLHIYFVIASIVMTYFKLITKCSAAMCVFRILPQSFITNTVWLDEGVTLIVCETIIILPVYWFSLVLFFRTAITIWALFLNETHSVSCCSIYHSGLFLFLLLVYNSHNEKKQR